MSKQAALAIMSAASQAMAADPRDRECCFMVGERVRLALATLTAREEYVVRHLFSFQPSGPRTVSEIAATFGVSRARVGHIRDRALDRMYTLFARSMPEMAPPPSMASRRADASDRADAARERPCAPTIRIPLPPLPALVPWIRPTVAEGTGLPATLRPYYEATVRSLRRADVGGAG